MWPQIAIAIVMMIVSSALQALTQPKPQDAARGTLNVPTAQEGDPIPVVFGTVLLKQPNVIWYGNPSTTPIYAQGNSKK